MVGPERVGGLEVVRLLRRRATPALALLVDRQPVEAHAEHVVAEGAVRPAVLHHRAEVGGAVEEHEERPLVPRRVRLREEAPSRVRLELVVQTLLQPLGHRLRRPAARVAQDWHDAHRDEHREERADDRVDRRLDGGVGGALQRGVRARLHQREQVLLEARKVEVLVDHLRHLAHRLRLERRRRELLEQRPRHRRREVDVVRVVQRARAVLAEPLHVRRRRLHKVDGGHVGDLLALRVEQQVQRDAALPQVGDEEQRRDDVAPERVVHEDLPRVVPILRIVGRAVAVEVEHLVDRVALERADAGGHLEISGEAEASAYATSCVRGWRRAAWSAARSAAAASTASKNSRTAVWLGIPR